MGLRRLLLVVGLLTVVIRRSTSYPRGAPDSTCGDMEPKHRITRQESTAPYTITANSSSIFSGDKITLRIESGNLPLKGFLVQAKSPNDEKPIGIFSTSVHQILNCGEGLDNAATHAENSKKSTVTLQWRAPQDFDGEVSFRATVVQRKAIYWTNVMSGKVTVKKRSVDTNGKTEAADPIVTTTTIPPPLQGIAKMVDEIYNGCGNFTTCFGLAAKCIGKQNCHTMATYTKVGSGKYEFELMGTKGSRPQYLAIGLSSDGLMGDDSVVVCVSDGSKTEIYHTWNKGRTNSKVPDPTNGLSAFKYGVLDGKMYCSFQRDAKTRVNGVEFDLDKESYHVLIAKGNIASGQLQHHQARAATDRLVSLGKTSKLTSLDDRIYKTIHGCLMVTAWICAASCGIIFARYFKKTWLNNKCCNIDMWFHMHRLFMVSTWLLTVAGFILILYGLNGEFRVSTHSLIGVVSVGLCFIQPFMATLRCHPGSKNRSIFNWLHWLVGNSAQILGVTAIFFGLELYFGETRDWAKEISWYILIVFVGVHVLCHLMLAFAQCLGDCKAKSHEEVFPMKDMTDSRMALQPKEGRQDAPMGCLRKFILGVYLPLNWIATILIVLLLVFEREDIEAQFTEWGVPKFWEE